MTITTTVRHTTSPESEDMIFSFLRTHPQGTLSTVSHEGIVQTSVINVFDIGNFYLAFMTKKGTRKYKNLQLNPTVSFLSFDDFGRTEVEVEGIARLVSDKKEKEAIMGDIKGEENKDRRHTSPFVTSTDEPQLFVIYPRKIHMTVYWEKDASTDVFHESMEFNIAMKN